MAVGRIARISERCFHLSAAAAFGFMRLTEGLGFISEIFKYLLYC